MSASTPVTRRALQVTCCLSLISAGALGAQKPAAPDPALAHAERLLSRVPLIDGHNDLPWVIRTDSAAPMSVEAYDIRGHVSGMTDIPRMRAGHLGAQFWSVYTPGEDKDSGYARLQLEQIDIARRMIARYPEALMPAYTAADIERAFKAHKVGSLLGLEGGHAIENSLGALRAYYDLGVRYMTLTHNVTLDWADASLDSARHGGLTPFGKEVVREMNRLGMLVDLAHVSPGTMSAALDVSEAPVIFSHSGARALVDSPRDVPDSILVRVTKNGGVVMVPFYPPFISPTVHDSEASYGRQLDSLEAGITDSAQRRSIRQRFIAAHPMPHATIKDVADQIEHIRAVAGVDHVGIGSDFDGIDQWPDSLEDVSTYPRLFAELIRRGWSDPDLTKLAGGNILRVMRQAEAVAARLQRERAPSVRTIRELDR
ncbi:MAG TPA: dipeptidase [Gemmatimonadales bacterium]|nr:dipeptidase [Gemmatimonadales bacterium]